jgi:hypothetical protein
MSKLFSLNVKDFLKGLVVSVIGAVLGLIQPSIEAGNLVFDWKKIGTLALGAGISYLIKQFITNSNGQIGAEPKK